MRRTSLIVQALCYVFLGSSPSFASSADLPTLPALEALAFATELSDPSKDGPLDYTVISRGLGSPLYSSAAVYLPSGVGPFPAATLSGGYTNTKEDMSWLGKRLASHGILTIIFTPSNAYSLSAITWAEGQVGAVEVLERENNDRDSALFDKILGNSFALMGYSFGGAGAILAAKELKSKVATVIPLNPYRPTIPNVEAPMLFVTGTKDTVARPALALAAFEAIVSRDYPRAFANISGADHFTPVNFRPKHDVLSALVIPWLKVFLAGDGRYETYFNGEKMNEILEAGEVFARPSDYIYLSPL